MESYLPPSMAVAWRSPAPHLVAGVRVVKMGATAMPTARSKFFTLALLAALAGAAGCELFRDSAESRARLFMETLVQEPDNRTRLGELAGPADGDPESVLDGLSTRLAIGYLRARHRQGMQLDFAVATAQRTDPDRRTVRVAVAAPAAGLRHERDGRIRFETILERSEPHGWRVTRVSAE